MLIVTDLSGNSEMINKFNGFEMNEELNGAFTLSFISYNHPDNVGHNLIMQEGLIEYDDYRFRIKQLRRQTSSIQVSCLSTYFDNADVFKYTTYGGTHTLSEFMTYVLSGTGWTWVGVGVDVNESKLIPNFGQNNVIQLIEILKSTFEIEIGIGKNNQITVSKTLGPDNDVQYRYGYNIVSITESIDTTKLKTYIEGFGANGLHVTYTSPYASNPGIGLRHADPVYDDNFVDANTLLDYLKTQIYDHPDSVIELDDAVLTDKSIGERVWLIHERMGFEYQTRVVARKVKIPNSQSTVTLGTYLPQSRTVSNALAEQKVQIDQNYKTFRSKIEQTNDKILLEVDRLNGADVELQSSIEIEAGRITQEVTDRTSATNTLQSNLTIQADRISTEVSNREDGDMDTYNNAVSKINQTATEIRSEVSVTTNALGGRIDTANSLISQQASEILLRVTKAGVISAINQTAEAIRISASKINIDGAVTFTSFDQSVNNKFTKIDGGGIYTGTINAEQIIAGIINATIQLNAAKIKTAPTTGGGYIELWNNNDTQPTIRFYGNGPHAISTGGADLIIDTGSDTVGHLHLRAGGRVMFDEGIVDFSGADSIVWGTNAPTAVFG
jgi:hypothetical protein